MRSPGVWEKKAKPGPRPHIENDSVPHSSMWKKPTPIPSIHPSIHPISPCSRPPPRPRRKRAASRILRGDLGLRGNFSHRYFVTFVRHGGNAHLRASPTARLEGEDGGDERHDGEEGRADPDGDGGGGAVFLRVAVRGEKKSRLVGTSSYEISGFFWKWSRGRKRKERGRRLTIRPMRS
jgi:hypothetical protein